MRKPGSMTASPPVTVAYRGQPLLGVSMMLVLTLTSAFHVASGPGMPPGPPEEHGQLGMFWSNTVGLSWHATSRSLCPLLSWSIPAVLMALLCLMWSVTFAQLPTAVSTAHWNHHSGLFPGCQVLCFGLSSFIFCLPEPAPSEYTPRHLRWGKSRGRPFWKSLGKEGGELCYL